eukprot:TRINITY_DN13730_c0_g1_i2.p2 TRINITY_DN13730_c0_g1~~TRINITY_DN13730_c0_g1_i2.p2  ORF type:complete len:112 (+),score=10.56 TRINITY_DN13730_c0_g1_i2:3-338(+)
MGVLCLRHCSSAFFFFQAEDGIRDHAQSRGLGDVYKRQPPQLAIAQRQRLLLPALRRFVVGEGQVLRRRRAGQQHQGPKPFGHHLQRCLSIASNTGRFTGWSPMYLSLIHI